VNKVATGYVKSHLKEISFQLFLISIVRDERKYAGREFQIAGPEKRIRPFSKNCWSKFKTGQVIQTTSTCK